MKKWSVNSWQEYFWVRIFQGLLIGLFIVRIQLNNDINVI